MNKFFDYIQPTIIRTSDNPELPENMRNRYLLNYNVFGIKYFEHFYLLTETGSGVPFLLMNGDSWGEHTKDVDDLMSGIELEHNDDQFDEVLDIPRLYINITEEFINDSETFRAFIFQAIMENSIYARGIDGFEAGKDYWLNTTLYNYLANTNQIEVPNFEARMPNYINEHKMISSYYDDLSNTPYKDYTNLEYYYKKNRLLDNVYTEEYLLDFYKNFCSIILEGAVITDTVLNKPQNQVYKTVLNYFKNYQNDNILTTLNLVLKSNTVINTNTTTTTSCNTCSSSSANNNTNYLSCTNLYSDAMTATLIKMLGDVNFYYDWFTIQLGDDKYVINDILIHNIKKFFEEWLELEISLDFTNANAIHSSFLCQETINTSESQNNYRTINNYLKVISYVENDVMIENTNKIKIYGEVFGELLPKLQF
jgi:hypothetical protein